MSNIKEVNIWHLCNLRGALRLEMRDTTRRGSSALSMAKREFKLSANATAVEAFDAVQAKIDQLLEEHHQ